MYHLPFISPFLPDHPPFFQLPQPKWPNRDPSEITRKHAGPWFNGIHKTCFYTTLQRNHHFWVTNILRLKGRAVSWISGNSTCHLKSTKVFCLFVGQILKLNPTRWPICCLSDPRSWQRRRSVHWVPGNWSKLWSLMAAFPIQITAKYRA